MLPYNDGIYAIYYCHIKFPGVYFIFRMLATMALASCFILLDAQTIQMCTSEKTNKQMFTSEKIKISHAPILDKRRDYILIASMFNFFAS